MDFTNLFQDEYEEIGLLPITVVTQILKFKQLKTEVLLCFILVLSIFFFACNVGKPAEKDSAHLTYKIDLNNVTGFDLTDIAEFKGLVPLETSENSLIGEIEKVFLVDSIIVVWDSRAHNVLVFNEKGDFKYKIGNQGGSPEEYSQIRDVYITSENLIQILDNKTRRILTFDLNGEYISRKDLNYYLYSFYPTENGIWGVNSYQDEDYYLVHISSLTNKIDFGYLPSEVELMVLFTNHFSKNEKTGDILFHYCIDDYIYKIEDSKLNPYIFIDFGQQKAPYHHNKTEALEEEMLSSDYMGRIHNVHTYNDHLFFSFYSHKSMENEITSYHAYISTKTSKPTIYQYDIKHSDEVKISPIPDMIGVSDGKLIYQIIPEILHPNSVDILKSMFPNDKSISLDSNPILVLYNLN